MYLYQDSGSVCLFCCSKIGGPIVAIYKSLTDTWMWKLGTRPRSFISRNTQIESSLQCGRASILYTSTPRIAWSHTGRNLHGVSIFGSEFGEKSGWISIIHTSFPPLTIYKPAGQKTQPTHTAAAGFRIGKPQKPPHAVHIMKFNMHQSSAIPKPWTKDGTSMYTAGQCL